MFFDFSKIFSFKRLKILIRLKTKKTGVSVLTTALVKSAKGNSVKREIERNRTIEIIADQPKSVFACSAMSILRRISDREHFQLLITWLKVIKSSVHHILFFCIHFMTQRLFDSRAILTNILTKYKYKTYWRNFGKINVVGYSGTHFTH